MQIDDKNSQQEASVIAFIKKQRVACILFLAMGLFLLLYGVFRERAIPGQGVEASLFQDGQGKTSSAFLREAGKPSDLFGHYYHYAYDAYKRGEDKAAFEYLGDAAKEKLSSRQYYQYHVLQAALLWRSGEYEEAKKILNIFHERTSDGTAFTYLLLGMIEEKLGNEEAMVSYYTTSWEVDGGQFSKSKEKLADYYFGSARYAEALSLYDQLAELRLPHIVMKLSLTYFFMNDFDQAIKYLTQLSLAERSRHLDQVYFIQAISHLSKEEYSVADGFFEKASQLALDERRIRYMVHWAESALRHQHFDQAIHLFQEILAGFANNQFSSHYNSPAAKRILYRSLKHLGDAYYYTQAYDRSRIFYQRYLDLLGEDQDDREFWDASALPASTLDVLYYLAVSNFYAGEYDAALASIEKLTSAYDLNARMLRSADYLRAQLYLKNGHDLEASRVLWAFINNWGRHPQVVYTLLELEITLNEQTFLEKYREFAAEYENDNNYKLILAKYFETVGDYSTVVTLLKRHGENSARIDRKIADLYLKAEEYDAAIDYYSRAERQIANSISLAEISNNQAYAYAKLGNIPRARGMLLSAAAAHKRQMPFYYNIALIDKKMGNDALYRKNLYQARLEYPYEEDTRLAAMVYFHSGLDAIGTYQVTRARGYLNIAYQLDPSNPKIAEVHNMKLLDVFK